MNRTLVEKVRCMLSNAELGRIFWAEAIDYACHLVNRLPSAAIGKKTPKEMWSGHPARDYIHMKVFGYPAYYRIKNDKLEPRAKKAIFIGFRRGVKGYKLYDQAERKIFISRDVTFDEASLLKPRYSEQVESSKPITTTDQKKFDVTPFVPPVTHTPDKVYDETADEVPDTNDQEVEEVEAESQVQDSIARSWTRRQNVPKPAWLRDHVAFALSASEAEIPCHFKEAVESSEADFWRDAMDEEMTSLKKNATWRLVKLPPGFAQREGIDYDEMFSPVVKHLSIRVLLALVARYGLILEQLVVKTAFLHGDLQEEIYMKQPPGYEAQSDLICKLDKSLYGLKQSPRQWYRKFDQFVLGQKYTRSQYDHCACFKKLATGEFIYLLLYVDDMLIAASSQSEIDRMKRQLSKQFEMKELAEARKILGMEICRDKEAGKIWLTQRAYIEKMLKMFGIDDTTKAVTLPLATHFQLSPDLCPKDDQERKGMKLVPYASTVCSLMYLMVCTSPDIAQAVGVVSRFMHDPGQGHWQAVKWILRYLKGTVDVGLVYERQQSSVGLCMSYTDSDYAGDIDRRRSTTGYLFTLAGGPVSCRSTLQSIVALSTTEAEYMTVTKAMKEVIWIQSAIFLASNPVHHAHTKHIDVRYHFVRDLIETYEVLLKKIDTKKNPADLLTKVLSVQKFTYCKGLVNVRAQR
ncbi:hypothetical protein KSP39_PZI005002 [Platanthera zijinensis]|uniref:Reverse transcriptase Ty1/copia-type domain-containing protein n=1 Tax=Platanthera zijinensis TaxID=2320716 RepID=A0AAP0BR60_9ASPA